jgi:hypothetical protein
MTNAVQPATGTSNRQDARRLWPVAVLVSFPIGGYLADLVVDGVGSVGAALVGGLIAGLIRPQAMDLLALEPGRLAGW